MVLGSPGKVVRELTPQQIEDLRWSALHYVENARRFKRDLQSQLAVIIEDAENGRERKAAVESATLVMFCGPCVRRCENVLGRD